MQNHIEYSVVLPAYAEFENIQLLLPRLKSVLNAFNVTYEIIVVDALTKKDNTKEICHSLNVNHIHRTPSDSYGDAVRTGIQKAQGNRIIFMDADGSHPPEFLNELIPFSNQFDLTIASRYIKGGSSENSKLLVGMSKVLNLFYTYVLKTHVLDVSNSFRIYQRNQLQSLSLQCQHFDVLQEILYGLIKKYPQIKIKEVPFSFKKRISGKSKRSFIVFVVSYIKTLFKLLWVRTK